jgi:hypothetical protein
MGQHKEDDLARWRGLAAEQVTSGKSVATFCRERGLPVWQFYSLKVSVREFLVQHLRRYLLLPSAWCTVSIRPVT